MEYYGQQNEIRNGLHPTEIVEKPDCVREYELCKQFGVLWNAGGIADQPHLWLLEQAVVDEIFILFSSMPALTPGDPNA